MLGIYANTFRTATRTHCIEAQEVLPKRTGSFGRLFRRKRTVCIDPSKL